MWMNTFPDVDEVREPHRPGSLVSDPTLPQRVGLALAPLVFGASAAAIVWGGLDGLGSAAELPLTVGCVLGLAGWAWIRWWPRDRARPCTATAAGGVELPCRGGFAGAAGLLAAGTCLTFLGLGWQDAVTPGQEGGRPGEVLVLLAPPAAFLGWVLVLRLRRGGNALRLEPEGLVYVAMFPRTMLLEWEEISRARLHRPWRQVLVVDGNWATAMAAYAGNQQWRPADIARLVTYYAHHRKRREELADPRAVERRRDLLAEAADG